MGNENQGDKKGDKKRDRRAEIQNAEKRYQELIEKRDELNAKARVAFEERNNLNAEKRRLYEEMDRLMAERKKIAEELNLHKKLRDEYQSAARELVNARRSRKKRLRRNLAGDIGALKAEIMLLERKQETDVLSIEEERRLLEEIKEKKEELARLEKEFGEQNIVLEEIGDLDRSIDELFAKGEEEHQKVVALGAAYREIKDRIDDLRKEIVHLSVEAKKKHEEGMALREQADKYHRKAVEMREKIIAFKKERREEYLAKMREIEEYNEQVKKHLEDEQKIEEAVDKAIEELFKKGKLEI